MFSQDVNRLVIETTRYMSDSSHMMHTMCDFTSAVSIRSCMRVAFRALLQDSQLHLADRPRHNEVISTKSSEQGNGEGVYFSSGIEEILVNNLRYLGNKENEKEKRLSVLKISCKDSNKGVY